MLVRNVRIILPDRIAVESALIVEGDRIGRILEGFSEPPVKTDSVIDLHGLTLFPGFIDVHIHGAVGVDTMEANARGLLQVAEFLASQGVTAWLPTLVPGPVDQYENAIQAIGDCLNQQDDEGARARIVGVHYEGPFVNSEQCGALQ